MTITDDQIGKIADHAFDREDRVHRFNDERYGEPLNIDTRDDLAAAVKAAVLSEAAVYAERAQGGYLVRDAATNITVAADGLGAGTAYRDKRFERDFTRLVAQENNLREGLSLEPATLCRGAVPYVETEREQQHEQSKVNAERDNAELEAMFEADAANTKTVEKSRDITDDW